MSGGEQARVLLARALAVDAPVLLADEPIAALDPYYQLSMMDILQSEATRGKLVITALHDLALTYQYANEVWLMEAGQVIAAGPPRSLLSDDYLSRIFGIKVPRGGFQILQKDLV